MNSFNSVVSFSLVKKSSATKNYLTTAFYDASAIFFYPLDTAVNGYTPNYASGSPVYDGSLNAGAVISTTKYITSTASAYFPPGGASSIRFPQFRVTTSNLSFSFWYYPLSNGDANIFIARPNQDNNKLSFNTSGHVRSDYSVGQPIFYFTPPSLNAWHHVVWTLQGATWKVYIDTVSQPYSNPYGSLYDPIAPFTGTYTFNLGLYDYVRGAANAYVSDLRIYNLVLNTTQIARLYNTRY